MFRLAVVVVSCAWLVLPALAGSPEIEGSVARLDSIDSVYDAAVKEIGSLGPEAVPYIVERLSAPTRLNALGAVWALKHMGDSATLAPILEHWASCRLSGARTEAPAALQAVIQAVRGGWETCSADTLDPRVVALFQAVLCTDVPGDSRWIPPTSSESPVRIYAAGLTSNAALDCLSFPFDLASERGSDRRDPGASYIQVDYMLQPVERPLGQSRGAAELLWGEFPEAVAVVQVLRRSSGRGHVWVLADGTWRNDGSLYIMFLD